MSIYRTNAKSIVNGPRWNVTRFKKWYVRIARIFVDLRHKYMYQRKYNQYLRDKAEWKKKYKHYSELRVKSSKRPLPIPPPPGLPLVYLSE